MLHACCFYALPVPPDLAPEYSQLADQHHVCANSVHHTLLPTQPCGLKVAYCCKWDAITDSRPPPDLASTWEGWFWSQWAVSYNQVVVRRNLTALLPPSSPAFASGRGINGTTRSPETLAYPAYWAAMYGGHTAGPAPVDAAAGAGLSQGAVAGIGK